MNLPILPADSRHWTAGLVLLLAFSKFALAAELPGTEPLNLEGDLSVHLRTGIDRHADELLAASIGKRVQYWWRDFSSPQAYAASVAPNRARLARILGVVNRRVPIEALELDATTAASPVLAETARSEILAVRWPVLEGVEGEGLLLRPKGPARARAVLLPDADQLPEELAGLTVGANPAPALWLAERGCLVVVPTLVDRSDELSGDPAVWMTNEPHREWIYRPAFEFGRHIIGYEIEKVLALVDWFEREANQDEGGPAPIGVGGWGEGGLLAFFAAAVEERIDQALVSGYFGDRQTIADEPIYRSLFGYLREFGDAEVASLITPRGLIVEPSPAPRVDGPPPARDSRHDCAAPGAIRTPPIAFVRAELDRLRALLDQNNGLLAGVTLIEGPGGGAASHPIGPWSEPALEAFAARLGLDPSAPKSERPVIKRTIDARKRRDRQVKQLVDHTQWLIGESERTRAEFWSRAKPTSLAAWVEACREYKAYFWDNIIGRLAVPNQPLRPRSRLLRETDKWTAHEVMLDVTGGIECWGILVVPKDLKAGEKRPVVVCQHGAEGLPFDVIEEDPNTEGHRYYHAYAARLAERGFITYAPHNFYRGGNTFRRIQRKLNPLGLTIFSVILAQHQRHLDWLGTLEFVDPSRIALYGLSYGGYTTERAAPLLERYAVAISSAEFNDMVRKKASLHDKYSFPFYPLHEYPEWNLANTFGYGDMIGMMAPRPFMVERGHLDGVAPDEWVAAEYAKIRRLYAALGIADKTEIEFFQGPHTIHGVGTFRFLHRHLDWPER